VVLGEVAVGGAVGGDRNANGGDDEAVGFARGISAMTAKTTSPGERYFSPSLRGMSLQCGGKMEETRTRFCAAMPASRSASSNEVRTLFMLAYAFGEKKGVWGPCSCPIRRPSGDLRYAATRAADWHRGAMELVKVITRRRVDVLIRVRGRACRTGMRNPTIGA